MKSTFFATILILIGININAQNPLDTLNFVKYNGIVKFIDNQYLLITNLSVATMDTIEVNKSRFYAEGDNPTAVGKIFFQKDVRGFQVYISTNGFSHPSYSEDLNKLIKVDKYHPITDTINLGNYIPFEIGKYYVQIYFNYYYKGIMQTITSPSIGFTVSTLPKNTLFNEK